ncbi:hypothetical protein APA_3713 [Pseudanabaena sp. lw0831]|uniref:lysozyme inhibitor LprI family protein n=1 Tax=Pseudanabaena sp. lw0831 TaxID=1357935 RepID=UPI001915E5CC|nr:lysozyme inhibitor LprI family protein [Pseudanabaena sp. lw0831]GBO55562.1 hypothetical protein APA_3713 [Pseudanabaena sp. lw0831]
MNFFLHSLTISIGLTCIAIAPASSETIANSKQFGVAPPACEGEAQLYLNICASRWAKTADFLRSLIYDEVYSRVPEARKTQLKAIEKTWNSYRDIHCEELSAPFRKGSIYSLLYFSCRARVTNDRIADLQGTNISQFTPDITTQRLSKILKNEKMNNSSGQRQWLQYQAQQCQFESLNSNETTRSVKQCRDRLAEGRLKELEAMLGTR